MTTKQTRIAVRLTFAQRAELDALARQLGLSVSSTVVLAVRRLTEESTIGHTAANDPRKTQAGHSSSH